MIEIKGLSYEYPGGFKALDNIDLTIGNNQSIGLIGANGAGKSTLFKSLTGLIPYEGQIIVDDVLADRKSINSIRKKIGYVVQESDDQMFMPKVFDDMLFGLINYGMKKDEAIKASEATLKELDIFDLKERYNHNLSGGEKKMAAIATILVMKPETVLFDEPTSSLDPRNRRKIINILNGINSTKVIASHDLDLIYDTCDRIILMNGGRIVAEGGKDEILRDEKLLSANMLELPLKFQK